MTGAVRSALAMSASERRLLLDAVHCGIVVAGRADHRGPLATPVWYDVDADGSVTFVTAAHSEKAVLIRTGTAVSFLVQDETPPQRFVVVEGTATVATADDSTRRRIARRHLPPEAVDGFIAMTPSIDLVAVTIRPTRWFSSDFGKLGAG